MLQNCPGKGQGERVYSKIEVLAAQEDPLRLDVLNGVDAIKTLGRVSISKSGEVHLFPKHDNSTLH